jgi:hypothetical protein
MVFKNMKNATCWLAVTLLFGGCRSGMVSPPVAAAIGTAIAVGVAGARRAGGDCYTNCMQGTQCNTATGLCEPSACGQRCKEGERCDISGIVPQCVPEPSEQISIFQGFQNSMSLPLTIEPPPPIE